MTTPEQQARDMLERMGIEGVQAIFAGYSSELADVRAERAALKAEIEALRGSAEPVAWLSRISVMDHPDKHGTVIWKCNEPLPHGTSLYTRPCVPLTDAQVDSIDVRTLGRYHFAREVELLHGIGEKK